MLRRLVVVSGLLSFVVAGAVHGQGLTGALIGTVKDQQGGVIRGAEARVSSRALIGGPAVQMTSDKGQLRFSTLPPGTYTIEIRLPGFATYRADGIKVGSGATVDVSIMLIPASVTQSVDVDGAGSRVDARDPWFGTRIDHDDLQTIPSRRASFFDGLRRVPGVSPTSPSSGTVTTVSSMGSGTNENQFLIDGTNMTCPCNGVARAEPGVDFIQEIQVQSLGASAEYGNVQGAVINVITRQGSERFAYDSSYYGQPAAMTSQPVLLKYDGDRRESGYERSRYRDFTTTLGGPAIRERLWFFGGYQYLRDYDSQPGTDPAWPRTYEQNKVFAKLTWRLAPGWNLDQSYHEEFWVSPDQPRVNQPIDTTTRSTAHVPAVTFGHLTHTVSPRTVWEVRVGRFTYDLSAPPTNGITNVASRSNAITGVISGAPPNFTGLHLGRTVAKGVISHYRAGLWGADHAFKAGAQIERGDHHTYSVIPTGVRYTDRNGPSAATYADPTNTGGVFVTTGLFAMDQMTFGDRVTVSAGLRFDNSHAISPDLPRVDMNGRETDQIVGGLGTLWVWNILSPRLGLTMKLDADGRTMLRASYGRFAQGVLTGEIGSLHPGFTPVVTKMWVPDAGDYTRITQFTAASSLTWNPAIHAPRTDEYGVGLDRDLGSGLQVAVAYVGKSGANFIGWEEIDPAYQFVMRPLADGSAIGVYDRQKPPVDQRFELTNPAGYSMRYNGLITALEKRRSHGWQAFGSYTYSRVTGLQPGSGGIASAAQVSTVAPPPGPVGLTFGRDPNDLTNARGILLNDRPHVLRATGSVEVPKTGLTVAANFQYFSGKPWAASASVSLSQNQNQRILIEPRGTRRLSSQSLMDLRVMRPFSLGAARVDLLFDVLNVLNETAEESIQTDVLVSESIKANPAFGVPTAFVDPRRVMLGIRLNLGKP